MLTDQKSFNVLDKETTIEIKLTSQNICKRRTIRLENFLKEGVDFFTSSTMYADASHNAQFLPNTINRLLKNMNLSKLIFNTSALQPFLTITIQLTTHHHKG
jgi:hypothetical protein